MLFIYTKYDESLKQRWVDYMCTPEFCVPLGHTYVSSGERWGGLKLRKQCWLHLEYYQIRNKYGNMLIFVNSGQ